MCIRDRVKAATKIQVRYLRNTIKSRPIKIIGFMLHNGYDMFMSREQFETFYWPGLKASIDVCVENLSLIHIFFNVVFMISSFKRLLRSFGCIYYGIGMTNRTRCFL